MNTMNYPLEIWYLIDKVIKVLERQQGLLSKEIIVPKVATGVSCVTIKIWTHSKGLNMFEVHYPEKILRRSVAFEKFCERHNLDLSLFDDCVYIK